MGCFNLRVLHFIACMICNKHFLNMPLKQKPEKARAENIGEKKNIQMKVAFLIPV